MEMSGEADHRESIFWSDMRGSNFRSWVVSIDMGYREAWCASVHFDESGELYFVTQYEPQIMCQEDPCLHLPGRCHWDDLILKVGDY